MRIIAVLLSAIALLAGLFFALVSLAVVFVTGEHVAILACFCILFVIALGTWQDN